ncbi:MAG: putative aminohydrolase SsnA [Anaerolineae bacterium]|nr:putative aminohydrolase SsnA [Anaerolineae bacterium]
MSLLVTNGQVFTLGAANEVIPDGAVYIEGDTIAEVGKTADLIAKHGAAERLDVGGKLVLPGMLCGHTHFYGAFARGMAIPGTPAVNFVEILEKLWWSLDLALYDEDVRYSALIFLVDAIKHGCTTMIDHHASPNAIDGSLDIIGEAVKEAGLRASLCYEVTDRNGMDGAAAGIQENARWLKKCREARDPQLAGSFGLHAALTLSDETLENSATAAQGLNTGFHIHVAEDAADQTESVRKYNLRVVERLQKFGILGPKSIAVHCVHLDEFEKDILRETGTHVTHQPRSNMNNAVGLPDVTGMLARGIPVALGNDGFSMFMVDEMKACYLAHKHNTRDPRTMPGDVVLDMAYKNNANLAQVFFPKPVGEITPGAFGDLVVWDYYPPTPMSPGNLPWHILFGVDAAVVTHTIASGKVLMKDRQLTFLDEAAIMARARELAVEVWKRVS